MSKKIINFAVLGLLLMPLVSAIELPPAPQGFTWQQLREIKASVLKPDGWYFKSESQQQTQAYFISKEDIDKNGAFTTGLTINALPKLKEGQAAEQAKQFIDRAAASKDAERWTNEKGQFQQFGCQFRNTDRSGLLIVVRSIAIANRKTNRLYLVIFESPAADWENAWKIGEKILEMLSLNEEV